MTVSYALYGYVLLPAALIAYVALCFFIASRVAPRQRRQIAKAAMFIGLFVGLLVAPLIDVIIGRVEFWRLCEQQAKSKVFRSVELTAEHLNPDGSPKIEVLPDFTGQKIGNRYVVRSVGEQVFRWPRIERSRVEIRDRQTGELLGESVDFAYWGGWLARWMPGHLTAERCKQKPPNRASLSRLVFQAL